MANAFVSISPQSERAKNWLSVFGRLDEIPVTGWVPAMATLPGLDGPQPIYMLDLSKITDAERSNLINHLAVRFNQSPFEVSQGLAESGCPVLATDVLFHTTDPLPLIMADDLDDDLDDGGLDQEGPDDGGLDQDSLPEDMYDFDEGLPL